MFFQCSQMMERREERLGIAGLDDAAEPASGGKLPCDACRHRATGFDEIGQDFVDDILIKDTQISIRVDIHFKGF